MNKFNTTLKYLKKYIFWVISILCLLTALITSSTISGQKSKNFKARESVIEGRFQEMQMLAGQNSPNEIVVAQKKEDVDNLLQNLMDAWKTLYEPQSQLFVNRWPEFRGDANAQQYQQALQDVWETQTLYESKNSLPSNVADAYRVYVCKSQARDFMERYGIYIPKLTNDRMGGDMAIATPERATDESTLPSEGTIIWDETNRAQMRNRFNLLYKSTGTGKANSTRKILIVQEDIWVYDILLNAIAKMNEHCEGAHDAVIKRIFEVDIANYASNLFSGADSRSGRMGGRGSTMSESKEAIRFKNSENRVITVEAPKASADESLLGVDSMATAPNLEEDENTGMADTEFETLFEDRYIDAYGNFMSAIQFSDYLKTKPEYKLMPIHVKVLINQNEIPQFMLNCMNADMPIFIYQISIKSRDYDAIPHQLEIQSEDNSSTTDDSGMSSGSRRKNRPDSGMMMEELNPGMNTGMTENTDMHLNPGEKDERKPEDVEFELWGMICIFNRPDASKFEEIVSESGNSQEESAEEGAEEGESSEESTDESGSEESSDSAETPAETPTEPEEPVDSEEAPPAENESEAANVPSDENPDAEAGDASETGAADAGSQGKKKSKSTKSKKSSNAGESDGDTESSAPENAAEESVEPEV